MTITFYDIIEGKPQEVGSYVPSLASELGQFIDKRGWPDSLRVGDHYYALEDFSAKSVANYRRTSCLDLSEVLSVNGTQLEAK